MTAPFNLTELARKAAKQILMRPGFPHKSYATPDEALEARAAFIEPYMMAFARDLILESGAVEALGKAESDIQFWIEHNRESQNPMVEIGQRMLVTRTRLQSALESLRSITEAERGGAESWARN
jgi:hypothetical protein